MKTRTFRRLLALCLSLLLLGAAAQTAFAADDIIDSGVTDTGVNWELKTNGTLTLNGKGKLYQENEFNEATPPWDLYDSYIRKAVLSSGITEITKNAFSRNESLTSVSIPKTVKVIGDSAFSSCTKLKKISLPASVISIGWGALNDTGWFNAQKDGVVYYGSFAVGWKGEKEPSSIKIKGGTTHISPGAFCWHGSLKSVSLPEGLKVIGEGAFYYSGLTSITIPKSVVRIEKDALEYCESLKTVSVKSGNKHYSADKNAALYDNGSKTLRCFAKASALTGYTVKPGTKTIGSNAFFKAVNLKKVKLADTVQTIEDSAFSGCESLKSIHLPDSVKTIGDFAFSNGYQLASVTGGKSVTSLGYEPFKTTLWCYQHNNGPLYIGKVLAGYIGFYNGAPTFKIKKGTVSIAPSALEEVGKYLTDVSLPSTLKVIGSYAFSGAKITQLNIPKLVKRIERNAFSNCQELKTVTFAEGLQTIENGAFFNCSALTKVNLPNSLKTLGDYAFAETALSGLRIPAGVKSIGMECADGKGFKGYTVDEANAYFSADGNGVLFNKNKSVLLHYPAKAAATSYRVPAGVAVIADYAFNSAKKLTEIQLPDGLKEIGDSAFELCTKLKKITLPDTVTAMKPWAFHSCKALSSVQLSQSLRAIQWGAFDSCESLTAVKIPASVRYINSEAFAFCKKLKKAVLAEGVTQIETDAFASCESLTAITLPKSLKHLSCWAFFDCKNLTKIVIKNKNLIITEYTGDDAIPFPPKVTIYAAAGSTAEQYCKSYHVSFQAV